MIEKLVSDKLFLVNKSLHHITEGDLDEKIEVYSSKEFTDLSNDINEMVSVLKGYIAEAEMRIEAELHLAKTIQISALPRNFDFNNDSVELFATMDTAKEVGGDFYDFFFVDYNMLALVVADVSGKGIPAALFMMKSKTTLRGFAETGNEITEVFEKVNNELCEGNDAEMFVTVWMGIVDLETGKVRCVNAGHEYPAVKRQDGESEFLKRKHGPPLGTIEGLRYQAYELQLEKGDSLFLYTDGVTEAIDIDMQAYGSERLLDALNNNKEMPLREMLPAVKKDIDDFAGEADQFDDITMMGFKFK
jgi:serine phosphatase RsbU (regulator of sigma subunit)